MNVTSAIATVLLGAGAHGDEAATPRHDELVALVRAVRPPEQVEAETLRPRVAAFVADLGGFQLEILETQRVPALGDLPPQRLSVAQRDLLPDALELLL